MLIDSHCHLDNYTDLPGVLTRAREAGVGTLLAIGIGDGPAEMHHALDLATASHADAPEIFASAGIHPQEAHQATPDHLERLRTLAQHPRCLAIGEIGLDFYHVDNPDVAVQHAAFAAQMRIAAEVRKPILIHLRTSELATPAAKQRFGSANAAVDFFRLVEEVWAPTGLPGVMHCFSGSPADARRALDLGFYLSFAGNLTYPRSTEIREAAAAAPADRILLETDAPFLAPAPHRGEQNEPALITHTAAYLASLRGISQEELGEITTRNFRTLFAGQSVLLKV